MPNMTPLSARHTILGRFALTSHGEINNLLIELRNDDFLCAHLNLNRASTLNRS